MTIFTVGLALVVGAEWGPSLVLLSGFAFLLWVALMRYAVASKAAESRRAR